MNIIVYPSLCLYCAILFLVVEKKWQERIAKLGFGAEDFFNDEQELLNRLVTKTNVKSQILVRGTMNFDKEPL